MYVSLPFASPTRKQDNKHGQPHDTLKGSESSDTIIINMKLFQKTEKNR